MNDDELRRWVEKTCREQNVPVKVTDPVTVRNVAALLRTSKEARKSR